MGNQESRTSRLDVGNYLFGEAEVDALREGTG